MSAEDIRVGSVVMMDGHQGTVTTICDWDHGLLEVRFPGGIACIGRSTFDGRFEGCYIISI